MAKLQEQALAISGQDCVLIARRHVSSEFARVWAWDVAFAMSRPLGITDARDPARGGFGACPADWAHDLGRGARESRARGIRGVSGRLGA